MKNQISVIHLIFHLQMGILKNKIDLWSIFKCLVLIIILHFLPTFFAIPYHKFYRTKFNQICTQNALGMSPSLYITLSHIILVTLE